MKDAYIVTAVRTPGCRRNRGAFAQTRPEDLITHIVNRAVEVTPGLEKKDIEDIMLGCAFPEAEQGLNFGRVAAVMAGFPVETTGATVNRFCASGLESIALASLRVMAGWSDIVIGAGVESMTYVPMGGNLPRPHAEWAKQNPTVYSSMGSTAENVAKRYEVKREDQDDFAYHSQMKAAEAQQKGLFTEVVPTPATRYTEKDGTWIKDTFIQDFDDGVRSDTTIEGLAKLKPAFSSTGSVTAGNSSQTTDGEAVLVIMSEDALKKFKLEPSARLVSYTTMGCEPDEMGVGPAVAIPKLLKMTGKKIEDIGLWEINEAFASQAIYCTRKLGLDDRSLWASDSPDRRLNINGGAIALGHPLGCTGSKLAATLIANMKRKKVKYGIESMCIGGGMGAAALFELC